MRQVKVAMACLQRSLNFGWFFHTEVLSKGIGLDAGG